MSSVRGVAVGMAQVDRTGNRGLLKNMPEHRSRLDRTFHDLADATRRVLLEQSLDIPASD